MSIDPVSPIVPVMPEHAAPDGTGRKPETPPRRGRGEHHHKQALGYPLQPLPSEAVEADGVDELA